MSAPQRRLGKGLSSLLAGPKASKLSAQLDAPSLSGPTSVAEPDISRHRAVLIQLDQIVSNSRQPRRSISDPGVRKLAESIKLHGLIQPVVVRQMPASHADDGRHGSQLSVKYELIAGERRWRAARVAGLTDLPAIIRHADDAQLLELALVENIHREDLNAIDRALAYGQFTERFGLTPEEVGRRVGEDRTTVTNYLRLLELPEPIRDMVAQELLSMGHARALVGIRPVDLQLKLAKKVVLDGLSVRALEDLVRHARTGQPAHLAAPKAVSATRPHIRDLEQRFAEALQTRVSIKESRRKNRGKIIIEYNSLDDFDRICELLHVTGT